MTSLSHTHLLLGLFTLRASLDYNEEVYWSRILGEWNNRIGYVMGSSSVGVYTTAMTSPVENFKHEWEINMVVHMAPLLATRVLKESSFLSNPKLSDKKLDLRTIPTWGFSSFFLFFFFFFSPHLVHHTNRCLVSSWLKLLPDQCTSSL